MAYLIDTNVLSEPLLKKPDLAVVAWLQSVINESFISAITIEEMLYGAKRMPNGQRKDAILAAIQAISAQYAHRILVFGLQEAQVCSTLRVQAWSGGNNIGIQDIMIAATAQVSGLIVVTRNTKDFALLSVRCINPFSLK
ncbi:MAG: PIN domain-containing protein [Coriobacteriales bacterium]|nr:PIN domain-containing protein [Coriobacteriales bacterium]